MDASSKLLPLFEMQTANWESPFMSVNDPFDFVVFGPIPWASYQWTSACAIVPSRNSTVAIPLSFRQRPCATQLPQTFAFSNGAAGRNDFHIDDATDDPEFHASAPSRARVGQSPIAMTILRGSFTDRA
jgi:hypothetical protein